MATFEAHIVADVLHHMNEDHLEDSLLIARAFGDPDAESATMTGLDGAVGVWMYTKNGVEHEVSVPWSRPISERPQIRRQVVETYRAACAKLGVDPRPPE